MQKLTANSASRPMTAIAIPEAIFPWLGNVIPKAGKCQSSSAGFRQYKTIAEPFDAEAAAEPW
jgi:hypothetical protein